MEESIARSGGGDGTRCCLESEKMEGDHVGRDGEGCNCYNYLKRVVVSGHNVFTDIQLRCEFM